MESCNSTVKREISTGNPLAISYGFVIKIKAILGKLSKTFQRVQDFYKPLIYRIYNN